MSNDDKPKGCGKPATKIAFRGQTRRAFYCDDCEYAGKGSLKPYATDVKDVKPAPGVFTGAAKRCGDETL